MRRSFVLTTTLILFLLALAFSVPAVPPDKCVKCQGKVQQDFEKCQARLGTAAQECYDQFNAGIVQCFATVCEQ